MLAVRPRALLAGAALVVLPGLAHAADGYPTRPVRIVVPTGAGGVTDVVGRVIAQRLGERLGQQVIVDNRPGAGGVFRRSWPPPHRMATRC